MDADSKKDKIREILINNGIDGTKKNVDLVYTKIKDNSYSNSLIGQQTLEGDVITLLASNTFDFEDIGRPVKIKTKGDFDGDGNYEDVEDTLYITNEAIYNVYSLLGTTQFTFVNNAQTMEDPLEKYNSFIEKIKGYDYEGYLTQIKEQVQVIVNELFYGLKDGETLQDGAEIKDGSLIKTFINGLGKYAGAISFGSTWTYSLDDNSYHDEKGNRIYLGTDGIRVSTETTVSATKDYGKAKNIDIWAQDDITTVFDFSGTQIANEIVSAEYQRGGDPTPFLLHYYDDGANVEINVPVQGNTLRYGYSYQRINGDSSCNNQGWNAAWNGETESDGSKTMIWSIKGTNYTYPPTV